MKFNKLYGITIVFLVLILCLGAVSAANDLDADAVDGDDGNLAVEFNDVSDTLSAGNSWYVKEGVTGGDGSELNPFGDLNSALSHCDDGDTIRIMSGTYKGTSNTGLTIDKNGLTIVSNDNKKPVFDGENKNQIFKITGNNVVIQGLELIKGKAKNGGALYIDGDNVHIDKCTVNDNNANSGRGGGIYIDNHNDVVISNCEIKRNKATYMAAGIYNTGVNTLIANITIYNSISRNAGGIYSDKKVSIINGSISSASNDIVNTYGGGIYLYGDGASGSLIENITFSSCYSDQGGAMALKDCNNVVVNKCDIGQCIGVTTRNQVLNSDGAAIWMNGMNNIFNNTYIHDCAAYGYGIVYVPATSTNTTFNNCTFERNGVKDYDGAAIYSRANDLLVNNSHFTKNHCSRYGGAVYVGTGDDVRILNSEFNGNYAEKGGAIYFGIISGKRSSNPVVDNCNFTNNGVFPNPPNDRNITKGGAIFSIAVNPVITNSNFTHNVGLMGGAVVFEYGPNTLENNTFTNNIAERYGGGAISSTKQGDTINNCTFINNRAQGYGGAVSADYPTITNSKFIGNHAYHGGAINTITAHVSDSEFYDNTADDGWYIVAATDLIENNNVHPEQNSVSLMHTTYVYMTYQPGPYVDMTYQPGRVYVDGYNAFCVEEEEDAPKWGVLWEDLKFLQNSISEEYVGEYLKILIIKYWHNDDDYNNTRDLINIFTDHDFKSSDNETIKDVIASYNSGYRVPTNNALRFNDDGTIEVFNFREIIVPSATQNVFAFDVKSKPNATVKKEVNTHPIEIGKQLDFKITVKNTGECNLTYVWINETGFSKGIVYDSFKSSFNWTYDKNTKLWTLNEVLQINKTADIILTFNVTESGKMQNNVSVGFSNHTFGNDTVNFTSYDSYTPKMKIEKISLTPEVVVGSPAFFRIIVTNVGNCELNDINVSEINSEGIQYINFDDNDGKWSFIGTMDHPKWRYNDVLDVNESAVLDVIYQTLKAGSFRNVVSVENNDTKGGSDDHVDIYETALKVQKITLTPKVPVGDMTSFKIRVANIGDEDLEGVYVKELQYDGLVYDHFTSESGLWHFDGVNKWTYDGILAGNEGSGEGGSSEFIVFFKTLTVGNFTNIIAAGSDSTNETTTENTTETFDNTTDEDTNETEDETPDDSDDSDDSDIPDDNIPDIENHKVPTSDLKRATGNPILALFAVLLMMGVSRIRKSKK